MHNTCELISPGSSQLGCEVPGGFLVPALSCPLLSTHQQCPVAPWHCRALYWPCSSHWGTKAPSTFPSGLVVCRLSLWCSQWVLGLSGWSVEAGTGLLGTCHLNDVVVWWILFFWLTQCHITRLQPTRRLCPGKDGYFMTTSRHLLVVITRLQPVYNLTMTS